MESTSFSNRSPPTSMAYLAELRKESCSSVVAFTDPCPCCGTKKRRCLYPSSYPRKKILVYDVSPSSIADAAAVTSSGDRCVLSLSSNAPHSSQDSNSDTSPTDRGSAKRRCYDPMPPLTPPSPAMVTPLLVNQPPSPAMAAPLVSDQNTSSDSRSRAGSGTPINSKLLESSSTTSPKPVGCSAKDNKVDLYYVRRDECVSSPKPMGSIGKDDKGGEEVRVGVRCPCGIVREIVLFR